MSNFITRWLDTDVGYSFKTSPMAIAAAVVAFICLVCAVFAGFIAPHNPFDLTTLELSNARLPPAWEAEGKRAFLLGTDDQGRDILSTLMYGARISLAVGFASVIISVAFGVLMGEWAVLIVVRLHSSTFFFFLFWCAVLLCGCCGLRAILTGSREEEFC